MQNIIKIILVSVFALIVGVGSLAVGSSALSRGFFYMSKFSTKAVQQHESPVIFYAFVAIALFWGVLLVAASIVIFFSQGQLRKDFISFVDSSLQSTPSPRWWSIVLCVLFVALIVCISLFFYAPPLSS